jgi:hypothetical protein
MTETQKIVKTYVMINEPTKFVVYEAHDYQAEAFEDYLERKTRDKIGYDVHDYHMNYTFSIRPHENSADFYEFVRSDGTYHIISNNEESLRQLCAYNNRIST